MIIRSSRQISKCRNRRFCVMPWQWAVRRTHTSGKMLMGAAARRVTVGVTSPVCMGTAWRGGEPSIAANSHLIHPSWLHRPQLYVTLTKGTWGYRTPGPQKNMMPPPTSWHLSPASPVLTVRRTCWIKSVCDPSTPRPLAYLSLGSIHEVCRVLWSI